MKWTLVMMTLAAALLVNVSVFAQNPRIVADGCQPACACDDGCGVPCFGLPIGCSDHCGLIGNVELTFMKYMQEGGVEGIASAGANFDLELAPRFELGLMLRRDLGVRTRYWFYDAHALIDGGGSVGIDAQYFDAELFYDRYLGRKTWLEFSLGLRYLDFKQDMAISQSEYPINSEFEGWGGTIAIEAKHRVGIGNVYARGRWSVLLGRGDLDYYTTGPAHKTFHDSTSTQTELGIGYEICRNLGCLGVGSLRVGGEWQTWENVVVANNFTGFYMGDTMEDAGFAGIVLRMEVRR